MRAGPTKNVPIDLPAAPALVVMDILYFMRSATVSERVLGENVNRITRAPYPLAR